MDGKGYVLVAQLCLTLCDPHGVEPARLLHPCDFLGKNTGVGCHFLLQDIFLTQGSNPGLQLCKQTLYHLSHQGSPKCLWDDFPGGPLAKNLPADAREVDSIPGLGNSCRGATKPLGRR